MKSTLALLTALTILTSGCTVVSARRDGASVDFHCVSLFSNSAIKGLKVDGTTKTTTNLLAITQGVTEPNSESITASGTALGELIGQAAKTAAKP